LATPLQLNASLMLSVIFVILSQSLSLTLSSKYLTDPVILATLGITLHTDPELNEHIVNETLSVLNVFLDLIV